MHKAKGKKPPDFNFYNKVIKEELNLMSPSKSLGNKQPYGVGIRSNKSGQREIVRDPDANLSIFDDICFKFYMIKYCEILGIEVLLGLIGQEKMSQAGKHNTTQISYYQKIKIVDFIIKHEAELDVQESSW